MQSREGKLQDLATQRLELSGGRNSSSSLTWPLRALIDPAAGLRGSPRSYRRLQRLLFPSSWGWTRIHLVKSAWICSSNFKIKLNEEQTHSWKRNRSGKNARPRLAVSVGDDARPCLARMTSSLARWPARTTCSLGAARGRDAGYGREVGRGRSCGWRWVRSGQVGPQEAREHLHCLDEKDMHNV
jgi:hypothetical protein